MFSQYILECPDKIYTYVDKICLKVLLLLYYIILPRGVYKFKYKKTIKYVVIFDFS